MERRRAARSRKKTADGATNQFEYGATGAQNRYRDPENEAAQTQSDLIGRPVRRTYADGTTVRAMTTDEGSIGLLQMVALLAMAGAWVAMR